jgi:hypothetical protein
MRFRTALSLAAFFFVCFTFAVWASPLPAQPAIANSGADTQSVTGKISSIGDAAFTLDVAKSQGSDSSTLQFLVDGSTKVEGRLTVGSQATVEYRDNGGKYVATHVVVTPASSGSY